MKRAVVTGDDEVSKECEPFIYDDEGELVLKIPDWAKRIKIRLHCGGKRINWLFEGESVLVGESKK